MISNKSIIKDKDSDTEFIDLLKKKIKEKFGQNVDAEITLRKKTDDTDGTGVFSKYMSITKVVDSGPKNINLNDIEKKDLIADQKNK